MFPAPVLAIWRGIALGVAGEVVIAWHHHLEPSEPQAVEPPGKVVDLGGGADVGEVARVDKNVGVGASGRHRQVAVSGVGVRDAQQTQPGPRRGARRCQGRRVHLDPGDRRGCGDGDGDGDRGGGSLVGLKAVEKSGDENN